MTIFNINLSRLFSIQTLRVFNCYQQRRLIKPDTDYNETFYDNGQEVEPFIADKDQVRV